MLKLIFREIPDKFSIKFSLKKCLGCENFLERRCVVYVFIRFVTFVFEFFV